MTEKYRAHSGDQTQHLSIAGVSAILYMLGVLDGATDIVCA